MSRLVLFAPRQYDSAAWQDILDRITNRISSAQVVSPWTPTLTFATPGDLNVVYSSRLGDYTEMGREITARFFVITSTFTHTTASGNCQITGIPFVAGAASLGALQWAGITKANYTDVDAAIASGTSNITFSASGSGQSSSGITAADMPTGGTVLLIGTLIFRT